MSPILSVYRRSLYHPLAHVLPGLCLGLGALSPLRADSPDPGAPVVELSTVKVDASRASAIALNLPKEAWDWRFGRIGDWEFLSSASDGRTTAVVTDLAEFAELLHWLIPQWPRPNQPPLRLILCGPRHTWDELRPTPSEGSQRDAITAFFTGEDLSCIVANAGAVSLRVQETHGLVRDGGFSQIGVEGGASNDTVDWVMLEPGNETNEVPAQLSEFLKHDYVRYLLLNHGWRSPPWFTEGLVQLVATAKVEHGRAQIGRLETARIESASRVGGGGNGGTITELSLMFRRRALIPLLKLFEVGYDDPAYLNPIGSTFSGQSLAFVHYCLYGDKGRQQAALLNWVNLLQSQPATEEHFRACFGMSTAKMNLRLRNYFGGGHYAAPSTAATDLPPAPEASLAPADPAQVAVFKAESQYLAHRPEAASELLETALERGFNSFELQVLRSELALARADYAQADAALGTASALEEPLTDRFRADRLAVEVLRSPQIDAPTAKRLLIDTLRLRTALPKRHRTLTRLLAEIFLRSSLTPDDGFMSVLTEEIRRAPDDADLQQAVARLQARIAPPNAVP